MNRADHLLMRITFRLDEDLLRRARLWAGLRGTTLNQYLREYLEKIATGEIEPEPAHSEAKPTRQRSKRKPKLR
jgi:predicted HicB family RNase H-like nuclease